MDQIQTLVEDYKNNNNDQLKIKIRDIILKHFYSNNISRLNDEQCHKLMVSLFTISKKHKKSTFEKSLERYNPNFPSRDGEKINFFPFFFRLVKRRINSIFKAEQHNTFFKTSKNKIISFTITEPQQIEELQSGTQNVSSEVIQSLLAEEIIPIILEAEMSIKNHNYRDPLLFMLLFPNNLSQQELAELFGIKTATINSNIKRAREKFSKKFNELIEEKEHINPETLKTAVRNLSLKLKGTLENNFDKEPEKSILISRFFYGWSREKVCKKNNIDLVQLKQIEQKVLSSFLSQIKLIYQETFRTLLEGGENMNFYEGFKQYLNGAPIEDISRSSIAISQEELNCFELIKEIIPTKEQKNTSKIKQKIETLSEKDLLKLCKDNNIDSAELILTIDDPSYNKNIYNSLINYINKEKNTNKIIGIESFIKKLDE